MSAALPQPGELAAERAAVIAELETVTEPADMAAVSRKLAGPMPENRDGRTRVMKAWQERMQLHIIAFSDLWIDGTVVEIVESTGYEPCLFALAARQHEIPAVRPGS